MADLFVVGLTGSTGAGKSLVAEWMARRASWTVIDADVLSRRVVEPGQPTLDALVEHFSPDILNADGTLNRKRLAERAFASKEETATLNALVHPAVCQEIQSEIERAALRGDAVVVIDAPLLLQAGLDGICRHTVAVVAPPAIRKARIMVRDGLTEAEADRRMQAQPSDEYYTSRVDTVLYNDGEKSVLEQDVEMLCKVIEGHSV